MKHVLILVVLFSLTYCGEQRDVPPGAEDVSTCLFFNIGCDDLATMDDADAPDPAEAEDGKGNKGSGPEGDRLKDDIFDDPSAEDPNADGLTELYGNPFNPCDAYPDLDQCDGVIDDLDEETEEDIEESSL